jgi:type VI secretion system protein ImpE
MSAQSQYQAGRLDEAIETLGAELRNDPGDAQRRAFLFELLCFAGKYPRAEKQLEILGQGTKEAALGVLLYRAALHAEQERQEMFQRQDFPTGTPATPELTGTLNGQPFHSISDVDPRIGARLELFAAGRYLWIPLQHIASIRMAPPKRLRDLLWAPAQVRTGAGFRGVELGEVLLPAIAPLTWQHPDGNVRLGRATEWIELDDGTQVPRGQKMLLVDDEEFPILEVRALEIAPAPIAPVPTGTA